jgi:hypothetical protein
MVHATSDSRGHLDSRAIRLTRCVVVGIALTALACSERQSERDRKPNTPREKREADSGSDSIDAGITLEPATERTSLVDSSAWQVMSSADDPFDDRPEDAWCSDGAYMPEFLAEEPVFSVDTGGCTYLTAKQRSLRHVVAGETLVVRVWHFALHAGESAMAHVAVRIGEKTLLDTTVPIPAAGGLINIEEAASESIPEGAPVYFHLHNHGDNSWSFVELSTGPSDS